MLFLSVQTRLCICSAPALRDWRCFLLSRKWETVQWIFFKRERDRYSWIMERVERSFPLNICHNREDLRGYRPFPRLIPDRSCRTKLRKYSCTYSCGDFRLPVQAKHKRQIRRTVTDKKIETKGKRKEEAKEEGIHLVYAHNVRVLRGVGVPPGGAAPRRATARRCDYK